MNTENGPGLIGPPPHTHTHTHTNRRKQAAMTTPAAALPSAVVMQAFPALCPALAALPKPAGKTLSYGTAGMCVDACTGCNGGRSIDRSNKDKRMAPRRATILNGRFSNPTRLDRPPGFRDRAELLDSTFQRMGVLAALRSRSLGGATIGGWAQ